MSFSQSNVVCMEDAQFKHPFTMLISGPSSSGKTVLIRKFLESWRYLIARLPNNEKLVVLWSYGVYQDLYNQSLKDYNVEITYFSGLPNDELLDKIKPNLIVVDDLMGQLSNTRDVVDLFIKNSHHKSCSVIVVLQNLFTQSKLVRDISVNSHYLCLLKSPRDKSQIAFLGRQVYVRNGDILVDAYNQATKEPYGYLILDFRSDTDDRLRLRTRVTTSEVSHLKLNFCPIIYNYENY